MAVCLFFDMDKDAEAYLTAHAVSGCEAVFLAQEFNDPKTITLEQYKNADVISVFPHSDSLKNDYLDYFPNLKLIATRSTGFNHIDLDYAKNLNVFVVSENQCVNDKLKHYDYDAVFLFGKRVEDLVDVKTTATYLINPIGDPSKFKSDNCDTIVVLSKLDTFNQHSRWKSLIGNRKVIFKTLDFGTQRIENVFKAIYTE